MDSYSFFNGSDPKRLRAWEMPDLPATFTVTTLSVTHVDGQTTLPEAFAGLVANEQNVIQFAGPDQFVTGRAVSVNPKGLKLDGEDAWRNFSKFSPDIVPPMRGQTVTLTLDRQGFIRAVDASGAPQEATRGRQAPTGQRDIVITRLACLKAAAEFAAARPQLKSGEVLKIAASWERWINRPAGDELTDAL